MELLLACLPNLLEGLKMSVFIFISVLLVALPCGFILAIIRLNSIDIVVRIIKVYIFIMRGTPLLLQIMFIFFGLPYLGITLDRLNSALIAFILNYTAYFAEIARGGIEAVPKHQNEAIKVLGIGRVRGFMRIIFKQVLKITLPSFTNEIISLVKDTSLVYIIGIGEILRAGQTAVNAYATPVPFIFVGIIYLILTAIITLLLSKVENKLKRES